MDGERQREVPDGQESVSLFNQGVHLVLSCQPALRHGSRRTIGVAATAVAALALLHPISILVRPGARRPAAAGPRGTLAFGLTATVVEQQPEHLRWTAEARGRLAVVAAVTYDPGWPATVDDAPVPVRRSGDGLVELDLPAG